MCFGALDGFLDSILQKQSHQSIRRLCMIVTDRGRKERKEEKAYTT